MRTARIQLKKNNFTIDEDGKIFHNASLAEDEKRLVSERENQWDNTELLDRLKMVSFKRTRYLEKEGNSYWRTSNESGQAEICRPGKPAGRRCTRDSWKVRT